MERVRLLSLEGWGGSGPPRQDRLRRRDPVRRRASSTSSSTRPDTPASRRLSPRVVAPGGTLLLFAGMAAGSRIDVDAFRVHYEEVSVVGSFHYTPADADRALSLLASGEVPSAPLLSGTRPLSEWREAFDEVERGEVMKLVIVP